MTTWMRTLSLILLWLLPSAALANDELITVKSAHSAPVTVQRLQQAFTANGWTILGTIDYTAHAAEFGVKIPARTMIAFANISGWIRFILDQPTVAIEVPTRVLVWEDDEGVWVTRDTPWYFLRHITPLYELKPREGGIRVMNDRIAATIDEVTR
jgi:uncharacterized protein (DUF302 family)